MPEFPELIEVGFVLRGITQRVVLAMTQESLRLAERIGPMVEKAVAGFDFEKSVAHEVDRQLKERVAALSAETTRALMDKTGFREQVTEIVARVVIDKLGEMKR